MSSKIKPISIGRRAPEFETTDDQGIKYSKSGLLGSKYLLYFYPRDHTPGCTIQACGFRDLMKEFREENVIILGISGGDQASHQKFRSKLELPFPLLLDPDFKIAKSFGVFGEKKFMGKVFDGIHRTSFYIDAAGCIIETYIKVKAKDHPKQFLSDLLQTVKTSII